MGVAASSVSYLAPYFIPMLVSVIPTLAQNTSVKVTRQWPDHAMAPALTATSVTSDGPTAPTLQKYTSAKQHADWLLPCSSKVRAYADVADGWKGEGSKQPSVLARDEAIELLEQFATQMPDIDHPLISADDDGSICLYWQYGALLATVMAHGDGTYSFYAEGFDDPARSDAEPVGQPLPPSLIATMTGKVVAGLIAA
jgi:hypothetical protein